MRRTIVCLLLIGFFGVGCKKKLFDYRHKYKGNWDFTIYRTHFDMADTAENFSATIIYKGEVRYGAERDQLDITYAPDCTITLKVSKNDVLSGFPDIYSSGELNSKHHMHLYLRSGGLGGGTIDEVAGVK